MIFHKLGLINKNQRGFTLLELLAAIAITGIITGGITMTIFQVFDINTRSSDHMIAVRQVQNAGYWFSCDAQMAQTVKLAWPTENPVGTKFPLTLTWTDWETNEEHEVTYTLQPAEPKQLERHHLIYDTHGTLIRDEWTLIRDETCIVAQHINPGLGNTSCKFVDTNGDGTDDTLIFKVTAKLGEESETRVYEVSPKPIMY